MKTSRITAVFFFRAIVVIGIALHGSPLVANISAPRPAAQVQQSTGIRFIENRGQLADTKGNPRPDLLYYTQSSHGVRMYFGAGKISYVFSKTDSAARRNLKMASMINAHGRNAMSGAGSQTLYRTDLNLLHANTTAQITRGDESSDYENFYYAHCPNGITNVHSYSSITYKNIYPNIDLIYREQTSGVKYDFVVQPGGNVRDIQLQYNGADAVAITADEKIQITNPLGTITEAKPYTYQSPAVNAVTDIFGTTTIVQRDGADQPVQAAYKLSNNMLSFDVGEYDHSQPLIIDPILSWCTMYGGAGDDEAANMTLDKNNNVIVAAGGSSSNFPVTAGVFQAVNAGGFDGAIIKFTDTGVRMWATYYGGSGDESVTGIAVDGNNNIIVAGSTKSQDFPVSPNAFQSTLKTLTKTGTNPTGFLVKLDPSGMRTWGTYFGGTISDELYSLAVDRGGSPIIAGETSSPDIPVTAGAFQTVLPPGPNGYAINGFIAKFDLNGSRTWATYCGGGNHGPATDGALGVAVDNNGNIVITGFASSTDFPVTPGAFQQTNSAAANGGTNSFLVKFDGSGNRLWATYLGGSDNAYGTSVAFDRSGNIACTGSTSDIDFPVTLGAFQSSIGSTQSANSDAYIARFDANGNRLWATYYGGNKNEYPASILSSATGNIIISGNTFSGANFPTTADAFQSGLTPQNDFLVEFDSNGARKWATQFGSVDSVGEGYGVAVDSVGNIYLDGYTQAANQKDFPITDGAFQTSNAGGRDAFVAKFCLLVPAIQVVPNDTVCPGYGTGIASKTTGGYAPYSYVWRPAKGLSDSTLAAPFAKPDSTTIYYLTVYDAYGCSAEDSVRVVVSQPPQIVLSDSQTICRGTAAKLTAHVTGGQPPYQYFWTPARYLDHADSASPGASPIATTKFILSVTDYRGCMSSDTTVVVVLPAPTISLNAPQVICRGAGTRLRVIAGSGAPPYTYAWTPKKYLDSSASDSPIATPIATTYFHCTVTDSMGCSTTDSVLVTVDAPPILSKADSLQFTICKGGSVTIGGDVVSGTPPYKYIWSPATGLSSRFISMPVASPAVSTIYNVLVTDSIGCQTEGNVFITVDSVLHAQLTTTGPATICEGDSITLSVAGVYDSYKWSTGDTTRSITVNAGGSYSAFVRSGTSCSGNSDTIVVTVVPPPSPAISGTQSVCVNGTAQYTSTGNASDNFAWKVTGGAITSGAGTRTITVQWGSGPTGAVDVLETSASGNCAGSATQVLVTIGSGVTPTITASGALTLCTGDSVILTAQSGFATYKWSTGATTQSIVVKTSGTYSVSVKDASGCGGTSSTITITVGNNIVPVITGATAFCPGDSASLDAGSGYDTYNWSTGATTEKIIVKTSGIFHVSVSKGLCSGLSQDVTVTEYPAPAVTITLSGSVLSSTLAATYQWYMNDTLVQGATAQTYATATPGKYFVTIIDANGCHASSNVITISQGAGLQATITLQLPVINAAPNEQVVIPLTMQTAQDLTPFGIVHYTAVIRFDKSVLALVDNLPFVQQGNDVLVTVTGIVPTGSATLMVLHGLALIGDADTIPLIIDSVGVDNTNITTQEINGALNLKPVCGLDSVVFNGAATLAQNKPNPFSQTAEIDYTLPAATTAELDVVDILGRKIATIASGAKSAGTYAATIDAALLPAGLYFCVLQTQSQIIRRTFQVAK